MGSLSMQVRTEVLCGRICDLESENRKLRELVRDFYLYEHGDCYSCRYYNECRKDDDWHCIAPTCLGERVRELKVMEDQ